MSSSLRGFFFLQVLEFPWPDFYWYFSFAHFCCYRHAATDRLCFSNCEVFASLTEATQGSLIHAGKLAEYSNSSSGRATPGAQTDPKKTVRLINSWLKIQNPTIYFALDWFKDNYPLAPETWSGISHSDMEWRCHRGLIAFLLTSSTCSRRPTQPQKESLQSSVLWLRCSCAAVLCAGWS